MPKSLGFLFLHIPKTAGTSFRLGAIRALGTEHCHFDYGRDSIDTSALVRLHGYEDRDFFRLGRELGRENCRLLGGHFGHAKYGPLFQADRVLAFCRHPREQLMSHYAHFVRHNDYRGNLTQFLDSPVGAGVQQRAFGKLPVSATGFVGVTERYEDSLRVIRAEYGLEIEPMIRNVNPDKRSEDRYAVEPETVAVYDRAVERDMVVYRRANALLDARLAALDAGYKYVHGTAERVGRSAVRGFAFQRDSDEPVTVELLVNGRPGASSQAVDYRPVLRAANAPRKGFVGFAFNGHDLLKSGDQFEVRVASSGQVLGSGAVSEAPEDR